MQRIHRYIDSHHPGYLRRLAVSGLRVLGTAYQQYDYHRRLARHTNNLQTMPPAGSRNRGRNRSRSTASSRSSALGSLPFTPRTPRNTTPNPRYLPTRARRQQRFAANRVRRVRFAKKPKRVSAMNRRSGGSFGKTKKVSISKYYGKNGVVSKQEFGASLSDPNALYIGHGLPSNYLVGHIARNIIKKLYTKAGLEIRDWADGPPFDAAEQHIFQFEWYASATSVTGNLTDTATFVTGNQYKDIFDKVAATMIGIQGSNPTQPVKWGIVTFFAINAGQRYMKAQLQLQRVHLDFEFISQLKIQNVTEAATGTGPNDDLVTNVEANPLIGKHYFRTSWKNGFDLHWRPGSKLTWDGFFANQSTGIIASTATDANASSGYNQTFDKPPPYFAFNSTKGDTVKVAPGEIKTSFIKFKTHIMWQNMYDKIYKAFNGTTAIVPMEFGSCKLVGLEKLLDSRLESDSNVTIQYEVMQQLKSTMVEVKQGTLPYVDIL